MYSYSSVGNDLNTNNLKYVIIIVYIIFYLEKIDYQILFYQNKYLISYLNAYLERNIVT